MPAAKKKHARTTDDVAIPDKLYFRIGEVAELAKLPAYVLRFWETEFSQLKPTKSSTGQRMYRRRDVENVLRIKKLLYEEGFTIAGAREKLREEQRSTRTQGSLPFLSTEAAPAAKPGMRDDLRKLQRELRDVLGLLRRDLKS